MTCDHAGRRLPRALGSLGLSEADLTRHVAWDIGAADVARKLAARLEAFLILQTYSRLVIDCNRPLGTETSIATHSEDTTIPGNLQVSPEDAELRASAIFHPYHERIRSELDRRQRNGLETVLVAVHSFTPRFRQLDRPWHAGVLYNRDSRLACLLLELLQKDAANALLIGDNQPYSASDLTDYGIIEHGERRGVPHVELEIRQDLIADEAGQNVWAERLARLLRQATAALVT